MTHDTKTNALILAACALVTGTLVAAIIDAVQRGRKSSGADSRVSIELPTTAISADEVPTLYALMDDLTRATPEQAATLRQQIAEEYGHRDHSQLPVTMRLWLRDTVAAAKRTQ